MSQSMTLDLPRSHWWTASEERSMHHQARAKKVRAVRVLAAVTARQHLAVVPGGRCTVLVTVATPTNTVFDPPNIASTVAKAALDGVVDAGILPDDDSRHVLRTCYDRGPKTNVRGIYRLTITLEEVPCPSGS